MTDRLYYRNGSLLKFKGIITESGPQDSKWYTVLDKSAFYPTSGGQQNDVGSLNDVDVIDVIEDPDGTVWHISDKLIGNVGDAVTGIVDSNRRIRHQQQHTAQHILSQAFIRLYELETVSVHLGEGYGTIELNASTVTAEQTEQAESVSNEVIRQNQPIEIIFAKGEQLSGIPLRKLPNREGEIRIIKIGDFDISACGGTHCSYTAEIGILKIIGFEKIRGHITVKFLAGEQAFEDYRTRYTVTNQLSQSLTCHVSDLPEKIEKYVTDSKHLQKQVVSLSRELLPIRADAIAATAMKRGSCTLTVHNLTLTDKRLTAQLAEMVADKTDGIALLLHDRKLFLAVPEKGDLNAGKLAGQLAERSGLKGGGSHRLAQLGVAAGEKLSNYAETVLELLNAK
ncbi:MAG: DHHA1 domain-containing protein [candidate division Zixibacteria bacterium]|nr:DHHA1 domain-containing protein [candidate division Zixibacteria bacterium]